MAHRSASTRAAAVACALLALAASRLAAQEALEFSAIEGWWRAELAHNGQDSEMFLNFVSEGGQPAVRLGVPDLGAWDFPFGPVQLQAEAVSLQSGRWNLAFDPSSRTLSGTAPEALVPVYRIPVTFRKIDTPAAPRTPPWNYPSPGVAWVHEAGSPVWAGLALATDENLLYVGTDSGSVQAIDAGNGNLLWLVDTLGSIRAQPTPHGDAVYVVSDDGYLYKFDAVRGTERWRVRVDTSSEPRKPRGSRDARFDRYGSAAAVDDRHVYVGSRDGNLYALDHHSGREAWRATAGDMITATPLLHGGEVIFGSYDKQLYSVRAADGKPVWQRDTRGVIATDLAHAGNRLIVGTRAYDLHGLDARNGTALWKYYYWFSWVDSGPAVQDGIAYVGSSDAASVYALDTRTGKLKWRSRLNGWCWPRPAVNGGRVYTAMVGGDAGFTTRRGALVALNRRRGNVVWAFMSKPPEPMRQFGFAASPVATKDRVYAADLDGRVYAFQARLTAEQRRMRVLGENDARVIGGTRSARPPKRPED